MDKFERYNLPKEVKFCKRCTMSNQRPRITFNEEGVCSACQFSDFKKSFDWKQREQEFVALLDKHRKGNGEYDVIVPCSGGKDSAQIAHKLKHKYGMTPLTTTWSPHIYTDLGRQNLWNMTQTGDLANILMTPAGRTHRKLTKLFFEILGDPFQPFIYGQAHFPLHMAVKYQIPLVMYGENGEVEYGGDMKNAFSPTRNWDTDQTKHYFSGIDPQDLVNYGISENDIKPYLPPKDEDMRKLGLEIHFWGYYHKWCPNENAEYCKANTGFHENPHRSEGTYSKYASLDDKIDGFHYWLSYMKFGIGRCTADAAHEIRDGYITRNDGAFLVDTLDGEFPEKHLQEFLEYCDITEETFWAVMESWRNPNIWDKDVNGRWKLKHTVYGTGLLDK